MRKLFCYILVGVICVGVGIGIGAGIWIQEENTTDPEQDPESPFIVVDSSFGRIKGFQSPDYDTGNIPVLVLIL